MFQWLVRKILRSHDFEELIKTERKLVIKEVELMVNRAVKEAVEQIEIPSNQGLTEEEVMALIRGFCTSEVTGINTPPVAAFTVTCDGIECTFNATSSHDPDGVIVSYSWDFGDGSPPASGAVVTHTFPGQGSYDITLTVTDDGGLTDDDNKIVTVSTITLVEAPDSSFAGDNRPSMPAKGQTYTDPHYGLQVRRLTDATSDAGVAYLRHRYARRNPMNADNSIILLEDNNGRQHLMSTLTGAMLVSPFRVNPNSRGYVQCEPVWHYTDPHILMALGADPVASSVQPNEYPFRVYTMNVLDGVNANGTPTNRQVLFDLENTNFGPATGHQGKTSILQVWPNANRMWSRFGEGNPSTTVCDSGPWVGYPRYWAYNVEHGSYSTGSSSSQNPRNGYGAIVYDLQTNTIIGVLEYADYGRNAPDHVAISHTGQWVEIGWANAGGINQTCGAYGARGSFASPCGLMIYNNTFTDGYSIYHNPAHGDWALDGNGDDVFVYMDFGVAKIIGFWPEHDAYRDLWTNLTFQHGYDTHISGRGYKKPGWAVVTSYAIGNNDENMLWHADKMHLIEVKRTGTLRRYVLGHTYCRYGGTDASQPTAAANYDLTRVIFASNFDWVNGGNGNDNDEETYMIEIPSGAIPTSEG